MRAAVMHGREDIRIEEVPRPEPGPGELLVEVTSSGVCGSDLGEWMYGPRMFPIAERHPHTGHVGPMTIGHEFGGRVVEVGKGVADFAVGDLVASGAGVSCGTCVQCLAGRTNLCTSYWTVGLQRHGGLAEYVAVPAAACLEVGSLGIGEHEVALVQPMSIAVHAVRRGSPSPAETVIVVGAGGIGAFIIYALLAEGHAVATSDLDESRLTLAEGLGARVLTESERSTVVYEVSGSPPGLEAALAATLPGGRTVAVGLQKHPATLDLMTLSLEERTIVGTNAHVFSETFRPAARLVAGRTDGWNDFAPEILPLEALTTDVLPAMAGKTSSRIKHLFDPAR